MTLIRTVTSSEFIKHDDFTHERGGLVPGSDATELHFGETVLEGVQAGCRDFFCEGVP